MVEKHFSLDEDEYEKAERRKALLGLTDREAYLRGLDLDCRKRQIGRPRRVVSHSLDAHEPASQHHVVEGFGKGIFEAAQAEREKPKKRR